MTLRELPIGKTATVVSVGGEGELRQHFLDMGLIPQGEVTMVKLAPMGDPMELRIHSYELTLRLADAEKIEIENIRDAKEQGKKGICILCAEGRKREFLADPKFLKYKGFKVADISDCGINLMYLPLAENADQPRFKDCARHPKVSETGFVLYYTDQCPFTYYWVPKVQEAAKEHGISFQAFHITDKEAAQNVPAPVTTYALFRDGEFLTQGIQSDKKFLALAGIK